MPDSNVQTTQSPERPSAPFPAKVTKPGVPSPPTNVQLWLPLAGTDQLTRTLQILWDDHVLQTAERYSGVAGEEIYRWRLQKSRLEVKRALTTSSSEPQGIHTDVLKLQIGDLLEIDKTAHTSLTELDRIVYDRFRASVPETSYGVSLGPATQVVAVALVLLTSILAAYVRAALNADAAMTRGTVFAVLLGSLWGKIAAAVLGIIPLASIAYLAIAIGLLRNPAMTDT